jgi:pimeloyl-ACP methyl ester carboxylesterase
LKRIVQVVSFLVLTVGLLGAVQLRAQGIVGDWQGVELDGSEKLRTLLKIHATAGGGYIAEIYSIDQSPDAYRVDSITLQGKTVRYTLQQFQLTYEGKLSADGTSIVGIETQEKPSPLTFERATKATTWTIPNAHKVESVEVEPGVKLEVLDWGGTGRPLVLLAGLGDSAHVFDQFAPKLTGKYHVYGITRRGYGASDTPPATGGNYSADRLGDDVIAVLDKLKLESPVLVGHSIAGQELSSVGSRHPERVAGLVYLDAGYPYALYVDSRGDLLIDANDMRKKMEAIANSPTPQQTKALIEEMLRKELPRYQRELTERQELLQEIPDAPSPSEGQTKSRGFVVSHAIQNGEQRYTEIKCSVLAIFADPHAFVPGRPANVKRDAATQARDLEIVEAQAKAFEALGPNVRVVRIPQATHYVFRSNEADVLREMNAFTATLP